MKNKMRRISVFLMCLSLVLVSPLSVNAATVSTTDSSHVHDIKEMRYNEHWVIDDKVHEQHYFSYHFCSCGWETDEVEVIISNPHNYQGRVEDLGHVGARVHRFVIHCSVCDYGTQVSTICDYTDTGIHCTP